MGPSDPRHERLVLDLRAPGPGYLSGQYPGRLGESPTRPPCPTGHGPAADWTCHTAAERHSGCSGNSRTSPGDTARTQANTSEKGLRHQSQNDDDDAEFLRDKTDAEKRALLTSEAAPVPCEFLGTCSGRARLCGAPGVKRSPVWVFGFSCGSPGVCRRSCGSGVRSCGPRVAARGA